MHQADRGHRAQAIVVQAQQTDSTAVEVLAQGLHQALQAHGIGQFDNQVGVQAFSLHGGNDPLWLYLP
ncbi:hypothetical protein D3C77_693850 [compost metagenome]